MTSTIPPTSTISASTSCTALCTHSQAGAKTNQQAEEIPLLDRFTNITLLLRLVVLLNQNNPVFRFFHGDTRSTKIEEERNFDPLDSVASILVLDDEVIAACYISKAVTVVVANQPSAETDLDLDIFPALGTSHLLYPLQVTAISNPQFKQNTTGNAYRSNPNPHQLRALSSTHGEDFWPNVQRDEWFCASG